jgi:glycosyltransferase involved in cell wall biosynthesis
LADLSEEAAGKIRVLTGDFGAALSAFGRPDVVHDHGIWLPCHRQVARVCRQRGIPRIVSPRGMLEPWALNHKKWKKRLAWWLYQRRELRAAAGLHATAPSESDQLRALGLKGPMAAVPNGVEVPEIEDRRPAKAPRTTDDGRTTTDERPRTTDGRRTALFLSRVHSIKGLPMLLEAWARVEPAGWRLRIVGPDEGGHEAELKALADRLGILWSDARTDRPGGTAAIEFGGSLEGGAKWRAMAAADLFVLPTHSENFGIVVAEALAAATPVITTQGAPWELLETERCGWWTPVSADGIAAALDEATRRSPEELAAMGGRGRAVVAERFAWERIAQEMIACYRWVLGEGPKPGCVV